MLRYVTPRCGRLSYVTLRYVVTSRCILRNVTSRHVTSRITWRYVTLRYVTRVAYTSLYITRCSALHCATFRCLTTTARQMLCDGDMRVDQSPTSPSRRCALLCAESISSRYNQWIVDEVSGSVFHMSVSLSAIPIHWSGTSKGVID